MKNNAVPGEGQAWVAEMLNEASKRHLGKYIQHKSNAILNSRGMMEEINMDGLLFSRLLQSHLKY